MGKRKGIDDFLERWLEVIDAHGEAAKGVTVWRKLTNGELEWLASLTVHEMERPEELLKDRWGGGTYVTQLRDEKGRYMPDTRATFKIGGAPKEQKAESDDERAEAKIEELQERIDRLSQQGSRSDALIMVELIRQQGELMRDLRNPPKGAYETNPVELVTSLVTNVTTAFAPLLKEWSENRNKEPDTIGRIEELTVLMELAKNMGGGGGAKSGFEVLAETLGKPIAQLVDSRAAPSSNPPTTVHPQAGGQPVPAGKPAWYPFLNPQMQQALKWAATGKDPEIRADFILDELTDEQLGPVYELLTSETFLEEFYATYPEAQQYREWFGVVFQRIVAGIVPPEELEGAESEPDRPVHPELGTGEPPSSDEPDQGDSVAPEGG